LISIRWNCSDNRITAIRQKKNSRFITVIDAVKTSQYTSVNYLTGLAFSTIQPGSMNRKGGLIMQDVNTLGKNGHTPLMDAAKEGNLELVADLLRRGANVNAKSDKGKTALHYAAANGQIEAVKQLISGGAEIDARDRDWHTPLMLAAIYGCNHTVQALIVNGADVNAKTLTGNTPLVYAENNSHPLAAALLKKAVKPKQTA
jgi:ankyrin repeat protein